MKIKAVYKITNPIGEVYIGSSVWIKKRISQHKTLRKDCGDNKLVRSLKKFGWDFHQLTFICICETVIELREWERYFQEFYNVLETGLNCALVRTKDKPEVRNAEYRKNLSRGMKGKIGWIKGKKFTEDRLKRFHENLPNFKRNTKLVFDLQTGIFYESIIKAAIAKNINNNNLSSYLKNRYKNKTSLILC